MMYVADEGAIVGLIAVADPVKATTPQALAALREAGVRIVMLSDHLHLRQIQLALCTPSGLARRYLRPERLVEPEPTPVEVGRTVGCRQLGYRCACVS